MFYSVYWLSKLSKQIIQVVNTFLKYAKSKAFLSICFVTRYLHYICYSLVTVVDLFDLVSLETSDVIYNNTLSDLFSCVLEKKIHSKNWADSTCMSIDDSFRQNIPKNCKFPRFFMSDIWIFNQCNNLILNYILGEQVCHIELII